MTERLAGRWWNGRYGIARRDIWLFEVDGIWRVDARQGKDDAKTWHGHLDNEADAVVDTTKATSKTAKPLPPSDLKGEAFAEWARITAFLEVGHIESIDHAALVVYCSAWAMFDAARKAFETHGPLMVGRDGGLVKNPSAQIMNDAAKIMLSYEAKFGFTPRDRINLGISTNHPEAGNSLEDNLAAL
ncbi:hypothetical protein Rhe02_83940 [Rhizocola hellebori]|uniref:Terminase n=1 Tax=Rhizocola hellebori TaxID=1392758 RepID=A0A8J3QIL9_9ACTN|nr:phage terminase small subunit P27 family [Rhizocola hellebori]GIH10327.1 hypothetical protein Rhe02_83940 [Rhizocola hellebori]